jgi:hypothetical protein
MRVLDQIVDSVCCPYVQDLVKDDAEYGVPSWEAAIDNGSCIVCHFTGQTVTQSSRQSATTWVFPTRVRGIIIALLLPPK